MKKTKFVWEKWGEGGGLIWKAKWNLRLKKIKDIFDVPKSDFFNSLPCGGPMVYLNA